MNDGSVLQPQKPIDADIQHLRQIFQLHVSHEPVLPLQLALFHINPVTVDIMVLILMSAVFLPLGWFMYIKGIEKARREGTLTRWQ